jgi:hypothetical protein
MVLFSVENNNNKYNTFSRSLSSNLDPFLVITTNEITDNILEQIDTTTTKNIIFQIPSSNIKGRDITFDFKVDIFIWNIFISDIEYLEFRGVIVKNQLTVKHFENMRNIKGLYIGSTNYLLFENEDVSKLPMIKCLLLNGYGMVIISENMKKWLEKLKLNGCICEHYI